ncbi:MAG: ABC transporter ATP-binding protein/permease [Coprobacillus sp.]|nr:ABC transporter ATP-binding protein/permease [Coprobacillus sp.]
MPRFQTTDKAQDARGALRNLIHDFSKYWPYLVIVVVCSILACVCTILVPGFLSDFTDTFLQEINAASDGILGEDSTYIYLVGGILNVHWGALAGTFAIILGCYIVSAVLNWWLNYTLISMSARYNYDIRCKLKAKLDKLPLKYFDNHQVGDILSTCTNDVNNIVYDAGNIIYEIISAVVLVFGTLIAMFIESWILALVAVATLPFSITIAVLVARSSQKHFVTYQNKLGNIEGKSEEYYSGFTIIKLFNKEKDTMDDFDKYNGEMMDADYKSRFYSSVIFPSIRLVNNIGYVFVAIIGGLFGTVGNVLSFIMYLQIFSQPIQNLGEISSITQQVLASSERIYTLLGEEEEVPDAGDAITDPAAIKGNIKFDHVDFSYDINKPLIEDMNLQIDEGQSIAIVGPTGAGKTTIVNLIMRFYDVVNGQIVLDGHNSKDYSRGNLRRSVGMVLQDTWLFNGTIRDNIKYGRRDATDEDVERAAKAAMADHFISTLPGGYDFKLEENGSNISQGQRQLITIARAILTYPKIMILDEATSSVDTRTEKIIQDVMNRMMENRTSFIIAHRLSTIKNAKLILVMNKGSIVEMGTHQELLDKKGFYAELYNSQFTSGINPMAEKEVIEDIKT